MSSSKDEIADYIEELREDQDKGVKPTAGGRAFESLRATVKHHGPLKVLVSILSLPFSFPLGILKLKSGG